MQEQNACVAVDRAASELILVGRLASRRQIGLCAHRYRHVVRTWLQRRPLDVPTPRRAVRHVLWRQNTRRALVCTEEAAAPRLRRYAPVAAIHH